MFLFFRTFAFGKKGEGRFIVNLDGAIGHPFNSTFKMVRKEKQLFHLELFNQSSGTVSINEGLYCCNVILIYICL